MLLINWDAYRDWRESIGEEYPQYPLAFDRAQPIALDETLVKGYLASVGYVGIRQGGIAAIVPQHIVKEKHIDPNNA